MEALYLLIPLSVAFIAAAAWIFLRMSDGGQFDDLDSPAYSILHDDDRPAGVAEGDVATDDDHKDDSGGRSGGVPDQPRILL